MCGWRTRKPREEWSPAKRVSGASEGRGGAWPQVSWHPFPPSAQAPGGALPCWGGLPAGTFRAWEQLRSQELVINDTRLLIILIRLGGMLMRSQVIHSRSSFFLFLYFPFSSWRKVNLGTSQDDLTVNIQSLLRALKDPPGQHCVRGRWRPVALKPSRSPFEKRLHPFPLPFEVGVWPLSASLHFRA